MKKSNNSQMSFGEAIPGTLSFGHTSEVASQNRLLGLMVAAIAVATILLVRVPAPVSQELASGPIGDPIVLSGATAEDVMPQRTESVYHFQSTDSVQTTGQSEVFQSTSSDPIQGSVGTASVR